MSRKITLTWVDRNSTEEGHIIYRSLSPIDVNSLPTPLATLGPDVTTYDDLTVEVGKTYYYRVAAVRGPVVKVGEEIRVLAHTPIWNDNSSVLVNFHNAATVSTHLTTHQNALTNKAEFYGGMGLSLTETSNYSWVCVVKSETGKAYYIPYDSDSFIIVDGYLNEAEVKNFGVVPPGTLKKWATAVLAPNGKIYCIPYDATSFVVIDPYTDTAHSTTLGVINLNMSGKWRGSTVGADGLIYCSPGARGAFLIIDPTNNTAEETSLGLTGLGDYVFYDRLIPLQNGKIISVVYNKVLQQRQLFVYDTLNKTGNITTFSFLPYPGNITDTSKVIPSIPIMRVVNPTEIELLVNTTGTYGYHYINEKGIKPLNTSGNVADSSNTHSIIPFYTPDGVTVGILGRRSSNYPETLYTEMYARSIAGDLGVSNKPLYNGASSFRYIQYCLGVTFPGKSVVLVRGEEGQWFFVVITPEDGQVTTLSSEFWLNPTHNQNVLCIPLNQP